MDATTHSFEEASGNSTEYQFPVGEDENHEVIFADLKEMPHLLVAGATGTGKSAFLHSMILTLIHHNDPSALRIVLFDSKIVEFSPYNGIPHLLIPVITNPQKLDGVLRWLAYEIMERLSNFAKSGKRSIGGYNDYLWENFLSDAGLPSILVIIDDISPALSAVPDIEESVQQILLKGRTVGVHLVIATQTPTWKSTKRISTQFRSKVLFSAATAAESKLLLGQKGAEALGQPGEALFSPEGASPVKVHAFMPSSGDSGSVISAAKNAIPSAYGKDIIGRIEPSPAKDEASEPEEISDDLLPAAIEVILETGQASTSMLQRRLKLGYSRAARIIDEMEQRGIVGPFDGSTPRQLLITREQWRQLQSSGEAAATEETSQEYISAKKHPVSESPSAADLALPRSSGADPSRQYPKNSLLMRIFGRVSNTREKA